MDETLLLCNEMSDGQFYCAVTNMCNKQNPSLVMLFSCHKYTPFNSIRTSDPGLPITMIPLHPLSQLSCCALLTEIARLSPTSLRSINILSVFHLICQENEELKRDCLVRLANMSAGIPKFCELITEQAFATQETSVHVIIEAVTTAAVDQYTHFGKENEQCMAVILGLYGSTDSDWSTLKYNKNSPSICINDLCSMGILYRRPDGVLYQTEFCFRAFCKLMF